MASKQAFEKAAAQHMETLSFYVPVVAKVHGKHHPEFHEVHTIFKNISQKIKAAEAKLPDLQAEFIRLRDITENFTVPEDVCESFEAVYTMLAELFEAYPF